MRVLHVSRLRSVFDLSGTAPSCLMKGLAGIPGVEVSRMAIARQFCLHALVSKKRLFRVGRSFLQPDAMINVAPVRLCLSEIEDRLTSILSSWRPDVVHVWGAGEHWQTLALRVGKKFGAILAITYDSLSGPILQRRELIKSTLGAADLIWATSGQAQVEFGSGKAVKRDPLLDLEFWNPLRVTSNELQFWTKLLGPRQDGQFILTCVIERAPWNFIGSLFTFLRQATERGALPRKTQVVLVNDDEESTKPRDRIQQLAKEAGLCERAITLGNQPKALIRSLYHLSDVVVFAPSCTTARWSALEAQRMSCIPFAYRGNGLAEPIVDGNTGFVYQTPTGQDMAGKLLKCICSREEREEICAQAKSWVENLGIGHQGKDCLEWYEGALASRRTRSRLAKPSRPTRIPDADWIPRTVLALDLDLTLIRPTWQHEVPTAYPLPSSGEVQLKRDLGPSYAIRGGLEALEEIFCLPWKAKVVCSMADQDKVDQVTRAVKIGSKTLTQWMDACVGNEVLDHFTNVRGIKARYHRERSLGNPNGRVIKSKPSAFFRLRDLPALGAALAARNRPEALQIAATGLIGEGNALVIDDNPYLEPSVPGIVCFQTIPFLDVEDFELVYPRTDLNAPLLFNFLDHVWRASAFPFHFLAYLIKSKKGWKRFRQDLRIEFELTEALRHADTFEQFKWIRTQAIESKIYARYLKTRTVLDRALDIGRYREHAKVYHALSYDHVIEDVRRGWQVLFLGRDMDYAYLFLATVFPTLVSQGKVASLPLSRASLLDLKDEDLMSVLCDLLPDLLSARSSGLRIYDVGFHGRVPARIARAVDRMPWSIGKKVEVALLNACACPDKPSDTCVGKAVHFKSNFGQYPVSRNFGISIERCPHLTGPLESLAIQGEDTVLRFSHHSAVEKARALKLACLMKNEALQGSGKISSRVDPVARVAHEAFHTLENSAPDELRQLRRIAEHLLPLSMHQEVSSIQLAVYPFFGVDLLTPLVVFTGLCRIIVLDSIPIRIDWDGCDFPLTAAYLAALTASLGADFSHSNARMSTVLSAWRRRFGSIASGQGRALACLPSLFSQARLLPGIERRGTRIRANNAAARQTTSWAMEFKDGRQVQFEYLICPADLSDPWLRATIHQELRKTSSALVLRDLPILPPSASGALREWSFAANTVLHDETAPLATAGTGKSAEIAAVLPYAKDSFGGAYRVFLHRRLAKVGQENVLISGAS